MSLSCEKRLFCQEYEQKNPLLIKGVFFMIKFRCKNCGQRISVLEIHSGKKEKCPKCKNIVVVPKVKAAGSLNDQRNPAPIDPEARERSPLPGTHLPSADNWCGTGRQQNSSSPVSDLQLEKEPPGQTGKKIKYSLMALRRHNIMNSSSRWRK